MRMTNWNVRISYRVEAMNEMVKGMCKYKTDICVLFQKFDGQGKGTVIKKRETYDFILWT